MPTENKLNTPQAKEYVQDKMQLIVAELIVQSESRSVATEIVKDLKEKYDLKPGIIRKVAKALADAKEEELLQTNSEAVALFAAIK